MTQYASSTSVSVDKSRGEIEKILTKYGAERFMYGWDNEKAIIGFNVKNKNIRFVVPLPFKNDYSKTPSGRSRKGNAIEEAYQQAVRQKWRALTLTVKAKLEAVESGIATFEEEFLSYIVLPGGKTVSEEIIPKLDHIYSSGENIPLLESF